MSGDSKELTDAQRLAAIAAQAGVVDRLDEQRAAAEKALRELVADARREGLLSKDLMQAAGWSRAKLAGVLNEAGVPPDRSAPRKRSTTT
ncbi:hypothetical protein [Amycolatopsis lurida]|uniref:hypothetical protein n=1 Tax=Amycolatopsis lurida TaxID=31959 RepID=UPI0036657661